MADLDQAGRVIVFDSEGVRGTVAEQTLYQRDGQALIAFDEGRKVLVPMEMLRRRDDGAYFLPLDLRALDDGGMTPEQTGNDAVIAVIPVVTEKARIAKRQVETGRVRIHKTVQTVEEQVDVPLLQDRVRVERVPVERYLTQPAATRYEGDTLVIPVMEEVVVVEKRLLLREEIHVTTVRERVHHQETVALQREDVTITRHAADEADR